MSQRSADDFSRRTSERQSLQDLVGACASCLHAPLPPLEKEDPEELLAKLHLFHERAGQLPADQQRPFLRGSWLPLQRLFWHRLRACVAAGPAEAELQRLWSLADDAQKLLKAAWCVLGSEEAELAASAAAAAAAALGQQQQQQQRQQQPRSSPTLEGCDTLLGVPVDTLASKGFELVNAPLAATFDGSLISLLFFAAESLKLLGQWGRRPMAAFYPNSKAFDDPVWGEFLRRCFRAASLLQWPALGGERPPHMIEYFINLLWHEAQVKHQDTHTGQRVVVALEAEFTQPGAPRGLAVHLAGSAEAAPASARLETGTRGRAVLGDTEVLSIGANVDGRKLEHAASSGPRVVSVVTNRNDVQVHGVQLDEDGRPVSTRKVELVPAPAGHGWAQMGVQPPAAGQPAAEAAPPAEADGSQPALPRDNVEVTGSLEVPLLDDPNYQPYITRQELLQSIPKWQPCPDGPPPVLRQFPNSEASGAAVAADQVDPEHIVDPVIRELFLQLPLARGTNAARAASAARLGSDSAAASVEHAANEGLQQWKTVKVIIGAEPTNRNVQDWVEPHGGRERWQAAKEEQDKIRGRKRNLPVRHAYLLVLQLAKELEQAAADSATALGHA
ncbi:hypothetical protein ABPG77_000986 [Micractinium sp. CCAP 211/92]